MNVLEQVIADVRREQESGARARARKHEVRVWSAAYAAALVMPLNRHCTSDVLHSLAEDHARLAVERWRRFVSKDEAASVPSAPDVAGG